MDKGTTMASYTASIGTAAGGLMSLNNIALILGLVFAAGTFYINWRSQVKRLELRTAKRLEDAEYHKARMAALVIKDKADILESLETPANDPVKFKRVENEQI